MSPFLIPLLCLIIPCCFCFLFLWKKKSFEEGWHRRQEEIDQLNDLFCRAQKSIHDLEEDLRKKTALEQELLIENASMKKEISLYQKNKEETASFVSSTQKQIQDQLEKTLHQLLKYSNQELSQSHEKNMTDYIQPLQQKIKEFEQQINAVYHQENKQRCLLQQEVQRLFDATMTIGQDARHLAQALHGNTKMQGSWGEFILEHVLMSSGLRKNHEYRTQVPLKSEEGNKYQPDVIIYLPDDKHIIIDSKVSLRDYQNYCIDEERQKEHQKKHVECLKNHVNSLAKKHYEKLTGIDSLNFVVLFIPIEPAFILALKDNPSILDEAFQKKIALASPSTLMSILKTVDSLWKNNNQNKNALLIAQQGAQLYDKCVNFIEALEDIGQKIDSLQQCYEQSTNRLYKGRGNIIRHIEKIKELGAEPRKDLPDNIKNKYDVDTIIAQ